MPRLFVTAMSAVTILLLGFVALQYRVEALAGAGLSGNQAEAYNLTVNVSSHGMTLLGNAMPLLFGAVIIVVLLVLLLLTAGR